MLRRARTGFTVVELLIAMVILGVLAVIAVGAYGRVRVSAEIAAVATESRNVFTLFEVFYAGNGGYPNASSSPTFQLDSFEPLEYEGDVFVHLADGEADAYDSPDDQGPNQEFWLLMTLKSDPTIRFIVASSDDVPLAPGDWLEGVYLYRDGVVTKRMTQ